MYSRSHKASALRDASPFAPVMFFIIQLRACARSCSKIAIGIIILSKGGHSHKSELGESHFVIVLNLVKQQRKRLKTFFQSLTVGFWGHPDIS